MNTTDHVDITIQQSSNFWLDLLADTTGMPKEQLVCSLFLNMARKVIQDHPVEKTPQPKKPAA